MSEQRKYTKDQLIKAERFFNRKDVLNVVLDDGVEYTIEEAEKAIDIIKKGGLACFPTETVFGLGCIASKEDSFLRMVKVKNRPVDKPFTLMCSSINQALNYIEYDEVVVRLMEKFFPGQLTIITKCKENIQKHIDLGTKYIGIRIPDDNFVLDLITKVGEPMLVTSANISSFKPALNDEEARYYFNNKVDNLEWCDEVYNANYGTRKRRIAETR